MRLGVPQLKHHRVTWLSSKMSAFAGGFNWSTQHFNLYNKNMDTLLKRSIV